MLPAVLTLLTPLRNSLGFFPKLTVSFPLGSSCSSCLHEKLTVQKKSLRVKPENVLLCFSIRVCLTTKITPAEIVIARRVLTS